MAYDSGFNAVFGHGALDKIGQRESVRVIQGIPPAGQEIFCNVLLFLVKNFFMLKTAHTSSMTPKAAILARPENGKYRSFTFLPDSMVDNQVSILYRASSKFPDAGFRLLAIRSYSREVWDWI